MPSSKSKRPLARPHTVLLGVIMAIVLAGCTGGNGQTEVVGTINGEPITREMFDSRLVIPQVVSEELGQVPPVVPKIFILDELVNEMLLLESANEAGITVSDEAVQGDLAIFLSSLGTTQEDFEARLLERGISWSTVEENVRRTLIVEEYKNNHILSFVMESERQEFLNSWLIVRTEQSTIEFEPEFLDEVYNE